MCFAICVMGKTSRPLAQASVRGSSSPPRHVPPARHFIFSQPLPFPSLFLRPIFSTPLSLPSFIDLLPTSLSLPYLFRGQASAATPMRSGGGTQSRAGATAQGRGSGTQRLQGRDGTGLWQREVLQSTVATRGFCARVVAACTGSGGGLEQRLLPTPGRSGFGEFFYSICRIRPLKINFEGRVMPSLSFSWKWIFKGGHVIRLCKQHF